MSQKKTRAQRAQTAARAAAVAARRAEEAARPVAPVVLEPVATDDQPPFAHRFATYPGDVAASLLENPLVGRGGRGEPMAVVYAHYDPVEDKTRAGFRYATVQDARAQLARDLAVVMKGGRP